MHLHQVSASLDVFNGDINKLLVSLFIALPLQLCLGACLEHFQLFKRVLLLIILLLHHFLYFIFESSQHLQMSVSP